MFVYPHTATRLTRGTVRNDANQLVPTWVDADTVKCRFSPKSHKTNIGVYRLEPSKETREIYIFLFPADVTVDYGDRFKNITDSAGNVLDSNIFQVQSAVMITSWGGKKHHSVVQMMHLEAE